MLIPRNPTDSMPLVNDRAGRYEHHGRPIIQLRGAPCLGMAEGDDGRSWSRAGTEKSSVMGLSRAGAGS